METLSRDYRENVSYFENLLGVARNFDIIKRRLFVGNDEITFFYVDGFVKDDTMQKLMQYFIGLPALEASGESPAREFADRHIPYVEVDVQTKTEPLTTAVLSGAVLLFGSTFGQEAVVIDARTYPARTTAEPDNDRVMIGSHDGFVETLIFNTALLRRRIRDPRLSLRYINLGGASRPDIVMGYMEGIADEKYVADIEKKLQSVRPASLTMGMQSLAETLQRRKFYNPFPKFRFLERPDAAAAELMEGKIVIFCDNAPQAMVLPTTVFDFMQETDDYCFPPLTGCYLRLLRHFVFWSSLFLTPLFYLITRYPEVLPPSLEFLIPEETTLPVLLQLFLVEIAVDGLKLASMNTPTMLTNSLSVIGGLILGDFAVEIGWLSKEVIFYMAIVAIAGFTQQSYELGYAFKFLRIMLLTLSAIFGIYGFAAGVVLVFVLLATNKTLNGKRSYLYPLIPFNARAMSRLFFRRAKHDFTE